jgi:tripartite ATP-independent transporter DctP family solute receptor
MKRLSYGFGQKVCFVAVLTFSALTLAYAGGQADGGTASGPMELKLGSTIPSTHPFMTTARKMGESVKERSQGRATIQVFPDGQLGKEGDIFEGVMMGTIQMYLVAPAMVARYYPSMAISDMAYVWKSGEYQQKVMRSSVGDEFAKGILEKTGTRVLDFCWDYGARQITVNVPARKPDDLKGQKIRCPESPVNVAIGNAVGYTPTPMDPQEVYTAIQQKVVDGQENPIPTIFARKFYEVNTHLILSEHIHQFDVLGINDKLFTGMPKDIQDIVSKAAIEGADEASRLTREQEVAQCEEMKKTGTVVITPDLDAFREKCSQIYKQFESDWVPGLYEKLVAAQK